MAKTNNDLVNQIAEEYLHGSSITEICKRHNIKNRKIVYNALDSLKIARRRHPTNWSDKLNDMTDYMSINTDKANDAKIVCTVCEKELTEDDILFITFNHECPYCHKSISV